LGSGSGEPRAWRGCGRRRVGASASARMRAGWCGTSAGASAARTPNPVDADLDVGLRLAGYPHFCLTVVSMASTHCRAASGRRHESPSKRGASYAPLSVVLNCVELPRSRRRSEPFPHLRGLAPTAPLGASAQPTKNRCREQCGIHGLCGNGPSFVATMRSLALTDAPPVTRRAWLFSRCVTSGGTAKSSESTRVTRNGCSQSLGVSG